MIIIKVLEYMVIYIAAIAALFAVHILMFSIIDRNDKKSI